MFMRKSDKEMVKKLLEELIKNLDKAKGITIEIDNGIDERTLQYIGRRKYKMEWEV